MNYSSTRKFVGALIAILGFVFSASTVYAETFTFGQEEGLGTSEQFGDYSHPDWIATIDQPLPPGLDGNIGKFIFMVSNNVATCAMRKNGNFMTFGTSSTYQFFNAEWNGVQSMCDFNGRTSETFYATSSYSLVIYTSGGGVGTYILGSTATTTVLIEGFSGYIPYDLGHAQCGYFRNGGVNSYCDHIVSLNLTFDSSSASTSPWFYAPVDTVIPEVCDAYDFFCFMKKGLTWAFIPSSSSFDKFSTLKDEIKNKPPFGYFTSAVSAVEGLEGSTTGSFELEEVTPIYTYIFSPLRAGLSWLIGFASLIWLYKRLTGIQI